MLDFNEELAKFQPCADLEEAEENIYGKELEEIKKNKTELYKANQMIKKYNQALNYAKQGNDDLAMLQLKNVVAAIPNFVDAYLLMALLSIKGENYDNARTFLDTILKIDPNNESAVEYGKEFETKVVEEEPQTTEPEKKDKKKKEKKKVVSQPEEPKKKKNPFNISSIQENEAGKSPMFYMVTGIVIGVIVAAVLIYPTVRASFSHKNSTQVEDYKEQILAKDTQLKASEKKVKEAKAAQKKAEEILAKAQKEAEEKRAEAQKQLEEVQAMQKRLESQLTKTEFAAKKVKVKAVKGVKKSVKVNWKSVEGADGYVIEYAKKANFKGKKTVTVSASRKAKTIKRLSAKKTYYVRVKAYKVVDNEKVYTAYSAKKKVRTK